MCVYIPMYIYIYIYIYFWGYSLGSEESFWVGKDCPAPPRNAGQQAVWP